MYQICMLCSWMVQQPADHILKRNNMCVCVSFVVNSCRGSATKDGGNANSQSVEPGRASAATVPDVWAKLGELGLTPDALPLPEPKIPRPASGSKEASAAVQVGGQAAAAAARMAAGALSEGAGQSLVTNAQAVAQGAQAMLLQSGQHSVQGERSASLRSTSRSPSAQGGEDELFGGEAYTTQLVHAIQQRTYPSLTGWLRRWSPGMGQ
jgi:hypothetical protein